MCKFLFKKQADIPITNQLRNYFEEENLLLTSNCNKILKINNINKFPFKEFKNTDLESDKKKCYDAFIVQDKKLKNKRILNFINNLCRASPNLELLDNKNVYKIGWRDNKFSLILNYTKFNRNLVSNTKVII